MNSSPNFKGKIKKKLSSTRQNIFVHELYKYFDFTFNIPFYIQIRTPFVSMITEASSSLCSEYQSNKKKHFKAIIQLIIESLAHQTNVYLYSLHMSDSWILSTFLCCLHIARHRLRRLLRIPRTQQIHCEIPSPLERLHFQRE